MTELRTQTRAEHARIEAVLQLAEPMSLARYAAIMSGFHAFLSRWEPRLHAALPAHLREWSDRRRRSHLAARDMQQVDATTSPRIETAAEQAVAELPLDGTASALGSMYVIEGSALGGQVVTPLLERHLGLTPTRGASYFHGHGDATGAMWRDFRDVITREIGRSDAAVERACQSAQRTFAALCGVFEVLPA